MQSASDNTLLREWTENQSHQAFRTLVDRYASLAWGVVSRRLTNPTARQDAVQQVFIDLARKSPSLANADRPLGPWLHRCAVLVCLQEIRRESRRSKQMKRFAAEGTPPEENGETPLEEILPALDTAILSLNEKDRQIVLGKFYHRQTYRQIAQDLGDSEAAVQRRGHRALERLAKVLRKGGAAIQVSALTAGLSIALAPPAPAEVASAAFSAGVAAPSSGLLAGLNSFMPSLATTAPSLLLAFVFGLSIPLVSARLAKTEPGASQLGLGLKDEEQSKLSALPQKSTGIPKLTDSGLDLAALRRELEKLPDPGNQKARQLELRRVMYALQDHDIPAVHDVILSLSHDVLPHADKVINSFFGRWAESDVGASIAAMEALMDGTREPGGEPTLQVYRIAGEAVLEWAMEDSEAAWAWLSTNSKSILDWRWAGGEVLGGLAARGTPIPDLLDLADATPLALGQQELRTRVVRRWLSGDQQAEALEHLSERYSPEITANLIGQIALKNAQSQEAFSSTAALLREIQVLDQRQGVARELFRTWFKRDAEAAWGAVLREQEALEPIMSGLHTSTNPYWIAGKLFGEEGRTKAEEALSLLSSRVAINTFVNGMVDGLPESEQAKLKAELTSAIKR